MSAYKSTSHEQTRKLPEPGHFVMVQCPGFRCLAYRDSKGNWHDAFHHQALSKVIKVFAD